MYSMFQEGRVELVLFTDALVTRGTVRTGQHRVTDILNQADEAFLVLEDVTVDELGSRGAVTRTEFAQVNLDAVLFAVATTDPPVMPELRTAKQALEAMISIPPFKVTGKIHLLPTEDNLRDGPDRADRPVLPGHGGHVLVRRPPRATRAGVDDRREPAAGADPRAAPRRSTRGPAWTRAGRPRRRSRRIRPAARLVGLLARRPGGPRLSGRPAGPAGRPTRPSRRRRPRRRRGRGASARRRASPPRRPEPS